MSDFAQVIQVFGLSRDAVPTNRGFYYQFLVTLRKWITNYIEGSEIVHLTEVEEDIKEVGNELVFTQVKCYVEEFSLNSATVQKSIFNFFILYLKYVSQLEEMRFVFQTNSKIRRSDKLLSSWVAEPKLAPGNLRERCVKRIKEILFKELRRSRNRMLSKSTVTDARKKVVGDAYDEAAMALNQSDFTKFVDRIQWIFNGRDPEKDIVELENSIRLSLRNDRFNSFPPAILFKVLLSEVYKRSSQMDAANRVLDKGLMDDILALSQDKVLEYADKRIATLFDTSGFELLSEVRKLQGDVQEHGAQIANLTKLHQERVNHREYPKELTFIPRLFARQIIGRDKELESITIALRSTMALTISGIGGLGKSILALGVLNSVDQDFDHLAWIDGSNGLLVGIAFDNALAVNLGLDFPTETQLHHRFELTVNRLKEVPGKTLIVIDNLNLEENTNLTVVIGKLASLQIKVLISSREKHQSLDSIELGPLDFANARRLVLLHYPTCTAPDNELSDFFQAIQFNTLMIELCAKTLNSALDLNFGLIVEHFKSHQLNTEELRIDIRSEFGSGKTQLFSQLLSTFDLSKLKQSEIYTLEHLSLLPSDGISIDGYIMVYGEQFYSRNKPGIVNELNSLHTRGWIAREGGVIRMHKLIQEVVRYKIDNYVGFVLFINYLCHRLNERNQKLSTEGYEFVKFADSLLSSIPLSKRTGIEQPLIILELNLIEAFRMLGQQSRSTEPMIEFASRAEKHLDSESVDLGVIYNNVATAYLTKDDKDSGLKYLRKSITILENHETQYPKYLIKAIDSLTALLINLGATKEALTFVERGVNLRNKYFKNDHALLAIHFNNLAGIYMDLNLFDKAIASLELAIQLHKKAPVKSRNDESLAMYYSNLSVNQLLLGNIKKSLANQLEAVRIFEDSGVQGNQNLPSCYAVLARIYRIQGDNAKGDALFMKAGNYHPGIKKREA